MVVHAHACLGLILTQAVNTRLLKFTAIAIPCITNTNVATGTAISGIPY